ncbi:hypothetical protein SAMN06265173_102140 [Thalassovita litoralis]|uniref:Sulfotransferase family protein n=1 Tax=Thalassovita litoralis TaxID=1010611 RepID=A0A521B6L8_9RHOB|nr:hypothetical protein [Thalassovita litoralis]SMO42310.1 hypothetical protein SAMN06265173_102140 [Thalassovita litoralis]
MSRNLTIILHVGPHKTGSTSLQKNLFRHKDTLAGQGIHFLGRDGPYKHLYSSFMTHPMKNYRNKLSGLSETHIRARDAQVREDLFAALDGLDGTAILSSEFLCKMTVDEFVRIRDALSRFGIVDCLYYYRELIPWIASNSQQMAKVGRFWQPSTYATSMQRLHRIPLRIAQVFGQDHSHFLKFETAVKQGMCNSLLREFDLPDFDALGLDETHENESLSDNAVRAMYLYNLQKPLGSGQRSPRRIQELCALPGDKYRIAGLRPHEIRDYGKKRAEVAQKLGFDLTPPENMPMSPSLDPENDRQIRPFLSLRERGKLFLKSLRRF